MSAPEYKLFRAIVDAGSLTAAAKKTRQSTAMVSKKLAALERKLGTQLIHRTTRRSSLTPAGHEFYTAAVRILEDIERTERKLQGQRERPVGRLRVSAPTSFGRLHIAPQIPKFLEAYPDVDLRLDLTDAYEDLIERQIDVAVRIAPRIDNQVGATRIGDNYRILCAAPSYLEANGVPKTHIELRELNLLAADGQLPWRLTGPTGLTRVNKSSHVRTNSSELVRELAIAGAGVALRSIWDISSDLQNGRLVRIMPDYEGSREVGIYAVFPRLTYQPMTVQAFLKFLKGLNFSFTDDLLKTGQIDSVDLTSL